VSDRIRLGIFGDADVQAAVSQHGDYIAAETLAVELASGAEPGDWGGCAGRGCGRRVGARRAPPRMREKAWIA
jgi:hypothetical protein